MKKELDIPGIQDVRTKYTKIYSKILGKIILLL